MNIHTAVNEALGLASAVREVGEKFFVSLTCTETDITLPCEALFFDEGAACGYADLIVRNFGRVAQ